MKIKLYFSFNFILPSQGWSKTRAFVLIVLLLCPRKTKFQLVKKERNLHSKYLFRHTRSLSRSLESSCYDKLILFLVFVCVSLVFCVEKVPATKETAREWINLHATSLCVALCAKWCEFCCFSSFSFFFGNATSCRCEKSSILIMFEKEKHKNTIFNFA